MCMHIQAFFQTFASQCDQCHSHINPEQQVYDNLFPTLNIFWLTEGLCACLTSCGFLPSGLACLFLLPLFRSHLDCLVCEFYGCRFSYRSTDHTWRKKRTINFLFKYMMPPRYTLSLHNYWLWISAPPPICCQKLPL